MRRSELEEAELQLEERKNDLEKAEEELGQLLQSGGAEDAEEFRVRAELSARRTSLEVKALSAHNRLQRLSGPGEALERLRADLTDTDPQSIDDAIAALEDERDNADAQISERDLPSAERCRREGQGARRRGGIVTPSNGAEYPPGADQEPRARMGQAHPRAEPARRGPAKVRTRAAAGSCPPR